MTLPNRKQLPHLPPPWVPDGELYFITICCVQRRTNTLAIPQVAIELFRTIATAKVNGNWNVSLVLLMPDHLHAFVSFDPSQPMTKTISSWKRYTARSLNINWQRGFFDHRIRNDSELREKWSYVLNNPVRANLVSNANDWPYLKFGT